MSGRGLCGGCRLGVAGVGHGVVGEVGDWVGHTLDVAEAARVAMGELGGSVGMRGVVVFGAVVGDMAAVTQTGVPGMRIDVVVGVDVGVGGVGVVGVGRVGEGRSYTTYRCSRCWCWCSTARSRSP